MNQFTEEWERLNEVTSVLNKRAEVPLLSQSMLSSQYTIPAMKLTGDAFRTTLALKNKYISEVNEQVLKPLDDFLKTDLKEFKESKKVFDKALEKYESTLAKYNGQSRQKEPSALREEAFQLYDTRKAYIQAAMSCSMLCIKFQDALDQLVLGVFLDLIATQHDYFSGNADHFGRMALQVLQLKTYMKGHKDASTITLQELEQSRERYTADAIEYWKPSRSLKCYSNSVPTPKSTIGHAALGSAFAAQMAGQMPLNTLMARPATISQFSTPGNNNRQPIPIQQLQAQPSMPNLSAAAVGQKPSNTVLAPLEGASAADTLSINTALPRSNNSSSLSLPNSVSNLPLSNSSSPTHIPLPQTHLGYGTPTTKQGYLNIRIPQPRNRAPVWQRKYFFIQEGEFGFESVVSNPTVGSQVVQSERIAVLLCEVRYGSSSGSSMVVNGGGNPTTGSQGLAMVQMERRFCFEVVCATQSYLLQAEAEDDLMSWVETFEAAKRDALLQQHLPRPQESDEPYSPIPDSGNSGFSFSGENLLESEAAAREKSNNDSEESKSAGLLGLGWAVNVPGVSLLLGNNAVSNKTGSGTDSTTVDGADNNAEATNPADQSETKTSGEGQGTTVETDVSLRPSTVETDASAHVRSWSIGDVPAGPEQRSGHTHQMSEIEKLMTSTLHLVPRTTPLAVSEIPHYPMELVVRNRELHLRFHGTKVHSKEYVLHSWTSGYLDDSRPDKPIMVYGRVFLTQSGMYFYARGLSVETKRMYRFSSIRGIECEQKDISTEWRIETMDGVQHIFSQFTLTDTEYQVLHLIWTNVHQAKDRLPVKELFRRTMLITSKPKGSAGSGSLAETESSHLITREGRITHPSGNSGTSGAESRDTGDATSVRGDDDDWNDVDEEPPASVELPSGPAACNCSGHMEKVELEQTYDVSAKTLNHLLFGDNSPVWKEFHARRNNKVQSVGEWTEKAGGHRERIVKFLMVVNNPLVKLNQADCVETQTCEVDEDYIRYSYIIRSNVAAMPYSDAFTPMSRYCVTYVDKNRSKLTCSSGIEWHKNPMVKAMIKGAVFKGTAETIKDISEILQLHLERRGQERNPARPPHSAPATVTGDRPGMHGRTESSKIMISLDGPDNDGHSILLNPQDGNADVAAGAALDSRVPGARRHTVSTAAGSGKVHYSGARVQGHWPTGSQPSFVPIGSKESRTRLLGRPSRSTLVEKESQDAKAKSRSGRSAEWIKKNVLGFVYTKDEKERRAMSTKLLYLVLVVSSLINIWAAYNSQRMLDTAWRLKTGSLTGYTSRLKGYPEPLHRIFSREHHDDSMYRDGPKNVRVAARAVYLKDLEEQMMSGELDGFDDGQTIDPKCFDIFMEARDSFRPWPQPPLEWYSDQNDSQASFEGTATSLVPVQPTAASRASVFSQEEEAATRHPWFLPHHRRWATRIIFQRDRVGILRHDLLVTFEVLKQLERRLLETEYINWITDERSRCRLWERRMKAARAPAADEGRRRKDAEGIASGSSGTSDADGSEDGEAPMLKGKLTQQQEMEQNLSREQVKERIAQLYGDPYVSLNSDGKKEDSRPADGDKDEDKERKQEFKTKVTKEFCEALEHQVALFMLDIKK
ncbi:hypothetical protein BC939DRAFT_437194 [Gamsiella multidivaricata]|uniref:uncharacterized protein n=1 Tax=Gamsiella multidivaricata TaxID=101098 RepID=UPI00221F581B|nr:uncharacterized protein BC939DRAFT_437194 [Gamsiella multidivaricata]KAI7831480.1 hypothetical protein BC939DRAFT_437194 [Gamsiella multidivaricata]